MTKARCHFAAALLAIVMTVGCTGNSGENAAVDPAAGVEGSPATVRLTHDYSKEAQEITFEIPSAEAMYHVLLKIGGEGPTLCASSQNAQLVVTTPDNQTFANLEVTSGNLVGSVGNGNSGCADDERMGVYLAPGTWKVGFSGSGMFMGVVSIIPAT